MLRIVPKPEGLAKKSPGKFWSNSFRFVRRERKNSKMKISANVKFLGLDEVV